MIRTEFGEIGAGAGSAREGFLTALRDSLKGLPPAEIERTLAYHGEMIDEMVEDGQSEAEAVESLGDPAGIALKIREALREDGPGEAKARVPGGARLLVALGSPVWFPLMIAGFAIVAALLLAACTVAFALYAAAIAVSIAGLAAAVGACFRFRAYPPAALFQPPVKHCA